MYNIGSYGRFVVWSLYRKKNHNLKKMESSAAAAPAATSWGERVKLTVATEGSKRVRLEDAVTLDFKQAYQWYRLLFHDVSESFCVTVGSSGKEIYFLEINGSVVKKEKGFRLGAIDKEDVKRYRSDMQINIKKVDVNDKVKFFKAVVEAIDTEALGVFKEHKMKPFYLQKSIENNVFCFVSVFSLQTSVRFHLVCTREGYNYRVGNPSDAYMQYLPFHKEHKKVLAIQVPNFEEEQALYTSGPLGSLYNVTDRLSPIDAEACFIQEMEKEVKKFLLKIAN